MKPSLLICILLITAMQSPAQKYFTKTGIINFKAGTDLEDIDAINKSVTAIFDVASGQIEFACLQKGFEFKRGLMQEHYNENYMESTKFPKAVFKGKFDNLSSVDFKKDGNYPLTVSGQLEMHGVKKEINVPGTITIKGGNVSSEATFQVKVADYNIEIPGAVKDKISPIVDIKVTCEYKVM